MHRFWIIGALLAVPCPSLSQTAIDTAAMVLTEASLSSVEEIHARLSVPPKGEFESTAEYNDRVRQAAGEMFYAVPVSVAGGEGGHLCWDARIHYDADAEEVKTTLYLDKRMIFADAIRVACDSALIRTYSATNSFGVAAEVREYSEHIHLVRVVDIPRHLGSRRFPSILSVDRTFPMPRAAAQELRPHMRLALVLQPTLPPPDPGRISSLESMTRPWLAYADTVYQSPTIQNPQEVTTVQRYVSAKHVSVWVYDARTGHVLHKLRLSE